MKAITIKSMSMHSLLILCATVLFSFSAKTGGDSFEIYLGGKMAIQQYVVMNQGPKSLSLDQSQLNEDLTVYYKHCGKTGTARTISIKDNQNKTLREWRFIDDAARPAMSCKVKELLNLQKNNTTGTLNLFYSSNELPAGRLLAILSTGSDARTSGALKEGK